MGSYPVNWSLVEKYDGNYIFEDINKCFCVNIDYTPNLKYPYSINFNQTSGNKVKINFEDGAYATHAKNLEDAYDKASKMMKFINQKANKCDVDHTLSTLQIPIL